MKKSGQRNRCILTDNAAKLYKYDGSGFLLCSYNAAVLLKRLYIRVGILQASKPVRKHYPWKQCSYLRYYDLIPWMIFILVGFDITLLFFASCDLFYESFIMLLV